MHHPHQGFLGLPLPQPFAGAGHSTDTSGLPTTEEPAAPHGLGLCVLPPEACPDPFAG